MTLSCWAQQKLKKKKMSCLTCVLSKILIVKSIEVFFFSCFAHVANFFGASFGILSDELHVSQKCPSICNAESGHDRSQVEQKIYAVKRVRRTADTL